MPLPPSEPGSWKAILEALIKPFTVIVHPLAERIGHMLERKPKLHIYVLPRSTVWCYAWEGQSQEPMMQLRFSADITNDGKERVLILDGYIKGTTPQLPSMKRIEIPPGATIGEHINLMVLPVVGTGGKDFTAKVILIDQLKRKHPTDEITFTWIGSTARLPTK